SGDPEMVRAMTFRLTREPKILHYVDPQGNRKATPPKYILHLRAMPLPMAAARQLAATFGTNRGAPMLSDGRTVEVPGADLPALPPALEMPEETEPECPTDLVSDAAPVGPDLGQKAAWAKQLEEAAALGKNPALVEKTVCRDVSQGEVSCFQDLDGTSQAQEAVEKIAALIAEWRKNAAQAKQPEPSASAAPAPQAKPRRAAGKSANNGLSF
ncbi:MAG: hypothetical protein WC485_07890, partial [Opitutaceae bacterium]